MLAQRKVLIKISGEELAGGGDDQFDDCFIDRIVSEICEVKELGYQVSLVVGGGNFWRGRDAKPDMDRVKADQIGMLATVMNAIYIAEAFREKGTDTVIMTPIIVGTVTEQFNKENAKKYLERGMIVIFAGGTGHPFFSTDTIAAIRAAELSCDAVLYAKPVDGVYDSDPKNNAKARKLFALKYGDIITNRLKVVDVTAASICEEQKIKGIIFKLTEPRSIITAATGTDDEIYKIGTIIS
ncbi:MAG: UMP kinase [Clostridiales bacterium]|nr:UMP kinase [Clostridiales bacterium]